jgi:hypothetical protein
MTLSYEDMSTFIMRLRRWGCLFGSRGRREGGLVLLSLWRAFELRGYCGGFENEELPQFRILGPGPRP